MILLTFCMNGCIQTKDFTMIKLYKLQNGTMQYWETWENNGIYTIHSGEIGNKGNSIEIKDEFMKSARKVVEKEMEKQKTEGFSEIPDDDLKRLLIEYKIEGMGNEADLEKRHKLEDRMNETLGWTGLGNCDGGSIGSGTMEVCCLVVDFEKAKRIVEEDLTGTEFSNFGLTLKFSSLCTASSGTLIGLSADEVQAATRRVKARRSWFFFMVSMVQDSLGNSDCNWWAALRLRQAFWLFAVMRL